MEIRYFAIAIAPTGQALELGRIFTASHQDMVRRYFLSAVGGVDGNWYLHGFHMVNRLAIVERTKFKQEWIETGRTEYNCPGLADAVHHVINPRRTRGRRTIAQMTDEAVARFSRLAM